MNALNVVNRLLEDGLDFDAEDLMRAEPESMTLDEYLSSNAVEDWVVENRLSGVPLDVPMTVREVDPMTLNTTTGYTLNGQREMAEQDPHREIVDRYRFAHRVDPILLDADRETILDGNHRAMAALIEERMVPAVSIADIP